MLLIPRESLIYLIPWLPQLQHLRDQWVWGLKAAGAEDRWRTSPPPAGRAEALTSAWVPSHKSWGTTLPWTAPHPWSGGTALGSVIQAGW